MFRRLLSAEPGNRRVELNLGRTQLKLGDALAKMGRDKEAQDRYQQALKTAESVLSQDTADTQAKQLTLALRVKLGLEKAEVVVVGLAPGRQGEQIGLQVGDVLTLYGAVPITGAEQFRLLTGQVNAGPDHLEIRRDGHRLELKTTGPDLGAQCQDRPLSEAK